MRERIGTKICKLRKKQSMTLEEMALKLFISKQKYRQIEQGQVDLSYELILNISSILNVEPTSITKSYRYHKGFIDYFKKDFQNEVILPHILKVDEILKLLFAHERLYQRMKKDEGKNQPLSI